MQVVVFGVQIGGLPFVPSGMKFVFAVGFGA